ncbi:MAG TPA: helix-turn-helix transcriptional regulator [Polyangiaceae bacterium]|jgi:DNA-binding CsgD family transcriptional regulator
MTHAQAIEPLTNPARSGDATAAFIVPSASSDVRVSTPVAERKVRVVPPCEELRPPRGLQVRRLLMGDLEVAVLSFCLPGLCFPPELTAAEREIASLLCEGRPLKTIAKLRRRSRCTILNQARSIYAKLGVHSRSEMVHRLVER